jgi:DNA-binding NarL/FixJ family response regulator
MSTRNSVISFPNPAMSEIQGSVLIVEDHPLVAEATADLLRRKHPALRVVCAESAKAALERPCTDWFRIFVDLEVPGAHGLSLVREIAARGYAQRCCVVTAFDNLAVIREARDLGVLGYIVKTSTVAEFVKALDAVLLGYPVFPSECAGLEPRVRLTRRQLQLLVLLQRGFSSKQIAVEWAISEGTVNNHVGALLRALSVCNRTHAVARAAELGLLAVFNRDTADQTTSAQKNS